MKSPLQQARVDEFLNLLAGCERRLYGYILSLVQRFHDADDIAQETRIRLWEQFDTYQPGTNFEARARTIAHYQVLTLREKRGRDRLQFQTELVGQLAEEYAGVAAEFEDRQSALLACLEQTTQAMRRLLQLVYAEGLSIKRAAERLDRPVEGTYKALSRARQGLEECVRRKLGGTDT